MKKLTAEWCRNHIESMRANGLSLLEEYYVQALEIALPVLEQQEVMRVPAYYIVYHPNPDPNEYDDKEHSHCGSIHLARRLATEIGGTICPVYIGEQLQPQTDTYRQIENDDWIECAGGLIPVDKLLLIEPKLRSGKIMPPEIAMYWDWRIRNTDNDIIAYRIIPERATNQNGEQ